MTVVKSGQWVPGWGLFINNQGRLVECSTGVKSIPPIGSIDPFPQGVIVGQTQMLLVTLIKGLVLLAARARHYTGLRKVDLIRPLDVSQFAFFSVLVYLRSCETSSVVARVLFQFKVRIESSAVGKPRSVLDVFLSWPFHRGCIGGDLCGLGAVKYPRMQGKRICTLHECIA